VGRHTPSDNEPVQNEVLFHFYTTRGDTEANDNLS
jgi:hypothetical protein